MSCLFVCLILSSVLSSPEGQRSPKGPRKPQDSHLQLDGSIVKRRNLPPRAKGAPKIQGSPQGQRVSKRAMRAHVGSSFFATRSMRNYGAERLFSLVFSSLLSWASQTGKTEELIFQNVAYRSTVYDTGVKPNDYICPNLTSKKQVSKLRGCIALHTFTTIHTSSHCTLQVFVNFCPILSEFSRFWVNSLKSGQKLTRPNLVHCRQTEKLIGKRESHLLRWRRSAV